MTVVKSISITPTIMLATFIRPLLPHFGRPVPHRAVTALPRRTPSLAVPSLRCTMGSVSSQQGPSGLTPSQANDRLQQPSPPTYLDVRTVEEFTAGHVPNAVNVPVLVAGAQVPTFVSDVEAVLSKRPLIVGCKSGRRSQLAIGLLKDAGWDDLLNLDGGFDAWAAETSLPVEM